MVHRRGLPCLSLLVALTLVGAMTQPLVAQAGGDARIANAATGTSTQPRTITVTGRALLPDATPARYLAIVGTEDGSAREVRALSDARGLFRLAIPAPSARWRLRALQVGRAPSIGPTLGPFAADASAPVTVEITITGAAVTLPTVSVQQSDVCGERAIGGATVASAWEAARTALLSARLRSDSAGVSGEARLRTEWIEYDRELDATGRHVRAQRTTAASGMTARAVRSIDADSLARNGYVVDGTDGTTTFHAPDADVLLSSSFAASHCVRLVPANEGDTDMIGVGFRPAREMPDRSDIEGVLWIDRASSELRRLQYRYTGLPTAALAAEPGGEVGFVRLPTGEWLVQRWSIRMPLMDQRGRTMTVGTRALVRTTSRTLTGVQVTGGEVQRVSRSGQALFEVDGAALEVHARSDDSLHDPLHAPLALRAELEGTSYQLQRGANGVLRLANVLPGSYRLAVSTALMDTLGVRAEALPITVDGDGRLVEWRLPTAQQLIAATCPAEILATSGAPPTLLRGTVRDARGHALPNAVVRVRWARDSAARRGEARVIVNDDARRLVTDSIGHWHLCGVPPGELLAVFAAGSGTAGDTLWSAPVASTMSALDLVLRRDASASLALRVIDAKSQPLRDVIADIEPLGGATFSLRTDADGRTAARDLPRGSATVRLRRVGFQEGTVTLELAEGANEVPVMLDPTSSPTLDTVRVRAARERNTRHSDFENRRALGLASASFSREDIEKRNPVSAWQMLSRVPSIIIIDSLGSYYAKSTRERTMNCWMRVAIDGRMLPEARFDLRLLPAPGEIHGIEVFAGPATIPLSMSSQGTHSTKMLPDGSIVTESTRTFCGVIAIWTR